MENTKSWNLYIHLIRIPLEIVISSDLISNFTISEWNWRVYGLGFAANAISCVITGLHTNAFSNVCVPDWAMRNWERGRCMLLATLIRFSNKVVSFIYLLFHNDSCFESHPLFLKLLLNRVPTVFVSHSYPCCVMVAPEGSTKGTSQSACAVAVVISCCCLTYRATVTSL